MMHPFSALLLGSSHTHTFFLSSWVVVHKLLTWHFSANARRTCLHLRLESQHHRFHTSEPRVGHFDLPANVNWTFLDARKNLEVSTTLRVITNRLRQQLSPFHDWLSGSWHWPSMLKNFTIRMQAKCCALCWWPSHICTDLCFLWVQAKKDHFQLHLNGAQKHEHAR
jgi:hypothetical protein